MAPRGSNSWRIQEWGSPCKLTTVVIPIYAGGPKVAVRGETRDAHLQLGAVFLRHGYIVRRIGCYNCRKITGGTSYSAHAWGIATDVNDDTNPYRLDRLVTDMPRAMIQDVLAIRTAAGVQAWRWGGDWDSRPETRNSNYDSMHFEIMATPDELAVGFEAQTAHPGNVLAWPVIRRGAKGPAVVELQRLLVLGNTTGIGEFGPRTEQAVRLYQRSRGLEADGIVGHATWAALLSQMPPLRTGDIPPMKIVATRV